MDEQTNGGEGYSPVEYPTLHALCERLGEIVTRVVPPVHVYDIPPHIIRGLFSVALVTRNGELHRFLLPYRDAGAIAAQRQKLAELLLQGDLAQAEGRIEVGRNTGSLLRYFLPNAPAGGDLGRRHQDRSHADWQAAAEHAPGPRQLWRVRDQDGAAVGGITVAGVHYLVRLERDGRQRLEVARARLGCRIIGELPMDGLLARDALGEWRQ